MALTKLVTTLRPQAAGRNFFKIGVNVILKEDGLDVFNQDFAVDAKKSDDPDDKTSEVLRIAQESVDKFLDERTIYTHPRYITMGENVNAGLDIGT